MTRKKYLQECANSYLAKTYESLDSCDIEFINCIIDTFEAGAKWADANPNSGVVDLSRVWHDAKEEPKALKQVVAIDDKGRSFSGNYWPRENFEYNVRYAGVYWNGDGCLTGVRLLDWEKVVKWVYIEDLLPKEGNEKDMK